MSEKSITDQKNIAMGSEAEKTALQEKLGQCSSLEISITDDFDPLVQSLNALHNTQLKPRPTGYHITVITPPEAETIRSMSADTLAELQAITEALRHNEEVQIRGIGFIDGAVGEDILEADMGKKTSYIALDVPTIAAFRASVGLPPMDLHITLGLAGDDIFDHYDSGVGADKHRVMIPKKPIESLGHMSPTRVHIGVLYGVTSRQPYKVTPFS